MSVDAFLRSMLGRFFVLTPVWCLIQPGPLREYPSQYVRRVTA
jgi:hypothetical protein